MIPKVWKPRRKRTNILLFIATIVVLFNIHQLGLAHKHESVPISLKDISSKHNASSIHHKFLAKYPFESVIDLSLNQRCDLFFQFLFESNKRWMLDPMQHYEVDYQGEEYNEFILRNAFRLTLEFQEKYGNDFPEDEFGEKVGEYMKNEFYKQESLTNQASIKNQISIYRLFNRCYMSPNEVSTEKENKSKRRVISVEHRVNPWLSKKFPVYEKWDGSVRKLKMKTDDLVLNQYKSISSGKGMVVTISEKHVEDTISLIHILRGLKNDLPMEIIYTGLSPKSKKKLINAAREEYHDLPPQEIWFVDISPAIANGYRFLFEKFDFKLLSMLFNSYEEFILLDADTVPFKLPSYFFNMNGYKQTGAFFFKDRGVLIPRVAQDGEFISSLGPSDLETTLFGIPQMTQHTLGNPFFRGLVHYQESGLLVINKNLHFQSILMVIQLIFMRPVARKSMGDKELYWMGFSLNGDENYTFNDNFAAAVGQLTPEGDRIRPDGKKFNSKEICSSHPGHISSEDGSLLWMNTGFKVCNKIMSSYDDQADKNEINNIWKHIKTGEDFKNFYNSPVKITHAILPPLDEEYRLRYSLEREPSDGWSCPKEFCENYMWCGYSSIGGEKNTLEGRVITFDEEEVKLFEYLGDLWTELQ